MASSPDGTASISSGALLDRRLDAARIRQYPSDTPSAAARAAGDACGAAFLRPLAKATQVRHILGAGAHAALAFELADSAGSAGEEWLARARDLAGPVVVDVLRRYPAAPAGGGRAGELLRGLDASLR